MLALLAAAVVHAGPNRIFASGFECGLECSQVVCPGTPDATSVHGTVYAPNGTLPLPNVTVYVPNGTVQPLPEGSQCARCDIEPSGDPLVLTTTGADGSFDLSNMPVASNVPLVIQSGKWRRQLTIPNVPACVQTQVAPQETRFARNASEGDLPRIALVTGGASALECVVHRLGIEAGEFTPASSDGRVHLYAGNGGTNTIEAGAIDTPLDAAGTLWGDSVRLDSYDLVLNGCEGGQFANEKPPAYFTAMKGYADAGGRVLFMHWQNVWLQSGPTPWPTVATWNSLSQLGTLELDIATGFDRGNELTGWVVPAGASGTPGKITLTDVRHTATGVNAASARRRVFKDITANGQPTVQYFSFTTPVEDPIDARCGRVAFSDIDALGGDDPGQPFPTGCAATNTLTPAEKLTAYILFDLGACVGNALE